MGWAKDEALRIASAQERVQRDRDWQMHRESVISRDSPRLIKSLFERIESDVAEFNAAARVHSKLRCEYRENDLKILKDAFPRCDQQLHHNGNILSMFMTAWRNVHSEGEKSHVDIRFTVNDQGDVCFLMASVQHSPETLAQVILGDVIALYDPECMNLA